MIRYNLTALILSAILLSGCAQTQQNLSHSPQNQIFVKPQPDITYRNTLQEVENLLDLPDEQFDIAKAVLIVTSTVNDATDIQANCALLDRYADKIRPKIESKRNVSDKVNALSDFLWAEGFHCPKPLWKDYSSREYLNVWRMEDTDFSRLLAEKKGNCLSLSILYISLARRTGIPLHSVAIPQHIYVRYTENGENLNIETTHGGYFFPDDEYREKIALRGFNAEYQHQLSDKQLLGCYLLNIGALYNMMNNTATSLDYNLLALKTGLQDPDLLSNIANNYLLLGSLTYAEKYFLMSLKKQPQSGYIYAQLGYIAWMQNNYNKSHIYLTTAISLLEKVEKRRILAPKEEDKTSFAQACLAMTYNYRANVFLDTDDPYSALEHAKKALDLWQRRSFAVGYYNYRGVVDIYRTLGKIYTRLEDYDKSIAYYNKALAQLNPEDKKPTKRMQGLLLSELAASHREKGDSSNAEKYFLEAQTIFKSLGDENRYLKVMNMYRGESDH
ncbi:MAG: tetratricopeptide repeat protein [Candidatus Auribacterota bacterium]